MLDTHTRKYLQPLLNKVALKVIHLKVSAQTVTLLALVTGLSAALLHAMAYPWAAIILLWLSGFLDALDGSVARLTQKKSDLGAFLDITLDRLVEISILYSFLFRAPEMLMTVFVLSTTFIMSLTVFLTVGSLAQNRTEKSFFYQAGITERTETFIFFTAMMICINQAQAIGYCFAILVVMTILMRFYQGIQLLKT